MDTLPIRNINIDDRVRKDMGDIDALAASMEEVGQLQPVVIGEGMKLIAGARRIKAAKKLGWDKIGYVLAPKLKDVVKRLKAERDENTQRKPLTNSELGDFASRLLAIEKPAAKKRQKAAGGDKKSAEAKNGKIGSGTLPEPIDARDAVGAALGVSGQTAERAAAVMEAANESPEQFGDLPAKMDAEGVKPAFDELKARKTESVPSKPTTSSHAPVKCPRCAGTGYI